MKRSSHSLAVALVLASIVGLARAQSGPVALHPRRVLQSVSIDLATGTITRGAAARDRAATTTVDFANNDLSGFMGADTGNGFCEWFDAGTKGFAGNASDLMTSIVFAYCSAMRDTSAGGPGGSVKLGFYEGYTLGGGAPTTAVALLTLTGLPAHSTSSAFAARFTCFFASVNFAQLVAFRDGAIGYSWKFLDTARFTIRAGTWPLFACVTSCSGAVGQIDGQGMTDAIDQYCPPNTLRSTFGFGTASGTFTSIAMEIREVADAAATITPYNAVSTPNPDLLSAGPARVGGTWSANLTRGTPSVPGSFRLALRANRIGLADGVQGPAPLPAGAGGRLLISGPLLGALTGAHDGTSGAVSASVPASFGLVCVHFAAQAMVLGGGVKVSSAVEGTIGTL